MHANSRIPEPGTYGRVLRRYDRDPRYAHQQRFASYDVNLRAVAAEMSGRVAMTLFFPTGKEQAAQRATMVGWLDCTDEWQAHLSRAALTPVQRLSAMPWNDLLSLAAEHGIDRSGRRPVVEERVRAWQAAQE